jgi:hypothetical protein
VHWQSGISSTPFRPSSRSIFGGRIGERLIRRRPSAPPADIPSGNIAISFNLVALLSNRNNIVLRDNQNYIFVATDQLGE